MKRIAKILAAAVLFAVPLSLAQAQGEGPFDESQSHSREERVEHVQQGVLSDYRENRQECVGLRGRQRAACDARAAATAESPQGRLGDDTKTLGTGGSEPRAPERSR